MPRKGELQEGTIKYELDSGMSEPKARLALTKHIGLFVPRPALSGRDGILRVGQKLAYGTRPVPSPILEPQNKAREDTVMLTWDGWGSARLQ